jgi:hypothetical protein
MLICCFIRKYIKLSVMSVAWRQYSASIEAEPILWSIPDAQHPYIMWVFGRRRLDGPCKRPGVTDPPLCTPVITGGCKMLLTVPCCHMFVYQTPTVAESTGLCYLIYIRFWREMKPLQSGSIRPTCKSALVGFCSLRKAKKAFRIVTFLPHHCFRCKNTPIEICVA